MDYFPFMDEFPMDLGMVPGIVGGFDQVTVSVIERQMHFGSTVHDPRMVL
jgi:hypothetical protein